MTNGNDKPKEDSDIQKGTLHVKDLSHTEGSQLSKSYPLHNQKGEYLKILNCIECGVKVIVVLDDNHDNQTAWTACDNCFTRGELE